MHLRAAHATDGFSAGNELYAAPLLVHGSVQIVVIRKNCDGEEDAYWQGRVEHWETIADGR